MSTPGGTSGVKRKRMPETKLYAVHKGARPGIYYEWSECLKQVTGFKGAIYKSFTTLTEAEKFVKTGLSSRVSKQGVPKFYAVRSGKVPGIYSSWEEASAQINGWTKPRYKSFTSKAEAEAFMKSEDSPVIQAEVGTPEKDGKGPAKKKKKSRESTTANQEEDVDYLPGEGPLPPNTDDFMDPYITLDTASGKVEHKTDAQLRASIPQASGYANDGMVRIWTDGSSRGNGTASAIAGVGVYFGPGDKRNLSEPLPGPRQTNQRAELTAILRALELSPRDRPLTIYSDSSYAINCVTTWFQRWRANGWVNAQKKAVENKDLIEKIVGYIEERERISNLYSMSDADASDETRDNAKTRSFKKGRARVYFVWVKGHANEPGNVAADALAVAGARVSG